jgi:hypothetical protein
MGEAPHRSDGKRGAAHADEPSAVTPVLAPFAVTAERDSQVATAVLHLVLGLAIGTLVSESARSAR